MAVQFRNLVFEGGGVRGIAYVGALSVLEERGLLRDVRRLGGTSVGAIHALLVALGVGHAEQEAILRSLDFQRFLDDSFGVIRDVRRLAREFGWNRGDFVSGWLGGVVRERLGHEAATFSELTARTGRELFVVGCNLSTGFAEVFSHERHPEMPVASAVRISMSIPLFFAAVRHGPRRDVYVDGGVQLNYPVKLFDRERYIAPDEAADALRRTGYYERENQRLARARAGRSPHVYNCQTLGFRLDRRDEIALFRHDEPLDGVPIEDFSDYARALLKHILNAQEQTHLHSDDWQRTVYLDTLDVGATDFSLPDEKKDALLARGRADAEAWLRWFEDPASAPVNRVGAVNGAPPPRGPARS